MGFEGAYKTYEELCMSDECDRIDRWLRGVHATCAKAVREGRCDKLFTKRLQGNLEVYDC